MFVTRPVPRLAGPLRRLDAYLAARPPIDTTAYTVSALLAASGCLHLVVAAVSDRPWEGPLSWRKPATFGLSFGLTLATVTWVSSYLRLGSGARRRLIGVFAADCVVEVTGVTLQAWRDVPSHLNTSTPANAAVAYVLAAGGGVLVGVLGGLAFVAFAGRVEGPPSLRLGVRAGFAFLLAGLASGAAMIARGSVLMRTGPAAAAYSATGFLKPLHAVTLHGIVVLPVLARIAARWRPDEPGRLRLVRAGVAVYAVAAVGVLAYCLVRAFG